MVISHEPPDYPVMSLEVARRGQAAHADCAESCSARAYFEKVFARLDRESRTFRSSNNFVPLRGSWNIWNSPA